MVGAVESPPGDPDGSGEASFKLVTKRGKPKGKVCADISFQGIDNPNVGHIHPGGAGEVGPPWSRCSTGRAGLPTPISVCVKARSSLVKDIGEASGSVLREHPQRAFPGGALRDQLQKKSGGGSTDGGGGGPDSLLEPYSASGKRSPAARPPGSSFRAFPGRDRPASGEAPTGGAVQAARIQGWAVVKVATISLVVIAAAVLLALVVIEIRTTLQWAFAGVFLALALAPAVALVERLRIRGRWLPRWLAILVVYLFAALFVFLLLQVIPPIVKEVEDLAPKLPSYVTTSGLGRAQRGLPRAQPQVRHHQDAQRRRLEPAVEARRRGERGEERHGRALNNMLAAITILALTFFLLARPRASSSACTGASPRSRDARSGESARGSTGSSSPTSPST